MDRTIAAICTPVGCGAIGVVRISGQNSLSIVDKFFKPYKLNSILTAQPNMMYLGVYRSENVCDRCLCVYFKAPYSYTGEDVVELQVHGGSRLVSAIFADLTSAGAYPAGRGEFTKRAFLNGKMSLTEAEGIAEMINADSVSAIRAAFRKQHGALDESIAKVKEAVIDAIAYAESGLDNPDEMESDAMYGAMQAINESLARARVIMDNAKHSQYIQNGVRVGILGKTNRGKSSLLNALCSKDRAIVTEIAGTTRDTLEESVEYKGIKIIFIDTAGIRESADLVEQIGVKRSIEVASGADALVVVLSSSDVPEKDEKEFIERYSEKPLVICCNKVDLKKDAKRAQYKGYTTVYTSALTGEGITDLLEAVYQKVVGNVDGGAEITLNGRQFAAISDAQKALSSAAENMYTKPLDCTLVDLYEALKSLTELDGSEVSDMVVDKVFEKFCVGK